LARNPDQSGLKMPCVAVDPDHKPDHLAHSGAGLVIKNTLQINGLPD
jgi:hypothetical protein